MVLEKLRASNRPTAITRGKRAAAVLMTVEAYERAERERSLLLRLAKGEMEIAAGVGYDLETVLADADRLLRPATP
jgi:PHD/YefM family antitoxin component YafN of YafNO toxin-antitoxin module